MISSETQTKSATSPASAPAGVIELPSDAPAAAKFLRFAQRGARPIAVSITLALVAAAGLASVLPGSHRDEAIVEVGVRAINEPQEAPLRGALRLEGTCRKAADKIDPSAVIEASPRRDEKSNAATRIIDVSVAATTSSAARAILDQGLAKWLIEPGPLADEDIKIHRAFAVGLQSSLDRLEETLDGKDEEERTILLARLNESRRAYDGVSQVLNGIESDRARVVSRWAEPKGARSRIPILLVAAVLFGTLVGAGWTGAHVVYQHRFQPGSELVDPFLLELISISGQHARAILACVAIGLAVGAAIGSRDPREREVEAVVDAAEISGASLDDLTATATGLETYIASLVFTGALDEGSRLEVRVLRDQPPTVTKLSLMALMAFSSSAEGGREIIKLAVEKLVAQDQERIRHERERLTTLIASRSSDLTRLIDIQETLDVHALRLKVFTDQIDMQRRVSPMRLHEAALVNGPALRPVNRGKRVSAFTVGFGLLGFFAGYAIAFLSAGAAYLRSIKSKGDE